MSLKSFEEQYKESQEPWRYNERGAERLRLLLTGEKVGELLGERRGKVKILDIGCSNGELSELLLPYAKELHCIDLSEIALRGARAKLEPKIKPEQKIIFLKGSSTKLPASPNEYDFVVCSDGIFGWNLTPQEKLQVVAEIQRVLKPGGEVLFVDYLKPVWIDEAIDFYQKSPLKVETHCFLGDRVWFKFESMLKAIRKWPVCKQLLQSLTIARLLQKIGLRLGKRGSNHIMVHARKISAAIFAHYLALEAYLAADLFIATEPYLALGII